MTYIFDASFGHAEITPQAVHAAGAAGVVLYAGCSDDRKNVTRAELRALLDAGVLVALVIENVATDAIRGASVGTAQGKAITAAAAALGYDVNNCVLFGGYDTDAHAGDYDNLLAYMQAFAAVVPVPGYYGDSDSIDYLHKRHPDWLFWQSDSRAFSPLNPTPNAHLLQLFNDPRARGLPVDVNDVKRTPLHFMGEEDMAPTALTADDASVIWNHKPDAPISDGTQWTEGTYLQNVHVVLNSLAQQVTALRADVAAVKASVAAGAAGGTVDPVALAQAIAAHVTLSAK